MALFRLCIMRRPPQAGNCTRALLSVCAPNDARMGGLQAGERLMAENVVVVGDDEVDQSRRKFLTTATVATGAVGAAFAAVPFISSWAPSERAKAAGAPVTLDVSKTEPGQMTTVV